MTDKLTHEYLADTKIKDALFKQILKQKLSNIIGRMSNQDSDEFEFQHFKVRLIFSESEIKDLNLDPHRFSFWFEMDYDNGGYCYAVDSENNRKIVSPKTKNREITEYEYMQILMNHSDKDFSEFDRYPTEVKDACYSCGYFTDSNDPMTKKHCHTTSCPVYFKKLVRLQT